MPYNIDPDLLQIVWYAKGHYGRSDNMMRDLRHLIGKWVGMDVEYIQPRDILHWIKLAWDRFAIARDKESFFEQLFFTHHISWKRDMLLTPRKNDYGVEDVISLMLSQFHLLSYEEVGLKSWDEMPAKYDLKFDVLDNGVHPVGHT